MRSLIVSALILMPLTAIASNGRLVDGSGTVERVGADGVGRALRHGDRLEANDVVRTGPDGHARVLVDEQAVVDLAPASQLRIGVAKNTGGTSLRLTAGRIWARVSSLFGGRSFELETENAVAGVRGTSFFAEVEGGATIVSVEAGSVAVSNRSGESALLGGAERARIEAGGLTRSQVESGDFDRLRERIAARERRDLGESREGLERARSGLQRDIDHLRENDRDDGRLREALREIMRNRRDGGLDIDPGIARRLLERLEELRALRRLRQ